MAKCDNCPRNFHLQCLEPPLSKYVCAKFNVFSLPQHFFSIASFSLNSCLQVFLSSPYVFPSFKNFRVPRASWTCPTCKRVSSEECIILKVPGRFVKRSCSNERNMELTKKQGGLIRTAGLVCVVTWDVCLRACVWRWSLPGTNAPCIQSFCLFVCFTRFAYAVNLKWLLHDILVSREYKSSIDSFCKHS